MIEIGSTNYSTRPNLIKSVTSKLPVWRKFPHLGKSHPGIYERKNLGGNARNEEIKRKKNAHKKLDEYICKAVCKGSMPICKGSSLLRRNTGIL